ncbi:MAG: transposase family protein, partial [Acidobacteria bacterium]|nr:transposase family protein [Acidobacteriota bacterium]
GATPHSKTGRPRFWRTTARLIKKVYEADPLVCPRCCGPLKIISLIGDGPVIEKILRHLKLWDRPVAGREEASQWPDPAG